MGKGEEATQFDLIEIFAAHEMVDRLLLVLARGNCFDARTSTLGCADRDAHMCIRNVFDMRTEMSLCAHGNA